MPTTVNIRRIVEVVKRMHNLPPVENTFSPFQRIKLYEQKVKDYGVPFPDDFNRFVAYMDDVEQYHMTDSSSWLGYCHKDLNSVNYLDDGQVSILDWEFTGIGDIYFDLATLVYAYDSDGPLPERLGHFMLECFF